MSTKMLKIYRGIYQPILVGVFSYRNFWIPSAIWTTSNQTLKLKFIDYGSVFFGVEVVFDGDVHYSSIPSAFTTLLAVSASTRNAFSSTILM